MKKVLLYVGVWLAIGLSVVSCDELRSKWGGEAQTSPNQTTLEDVAEDFGEAWFNWRYADVQSMVTPSSMQRVRFAASNVTITAADGKSIQGAAEERRGGFP